MRCFGDGDPLYERYHDEEWGRPQMSEQQLYEKACLEGFQAGLAWITVLRKREALREAFHGFDPERVVDLDEAPLLLDPRLIRSPAKVHACVVNAAATLALRDAGGLPAVVLEHADTTSPAPKRWEDVPGLTAASTALSKRLKRVGFTFVGPTTCYSLLQACGLVGDHLRGCHVREEVEEQRLAALAVARP